MDRHRTRTAQHRTRGGAGLRIELGANLDDDRARQQRAPDAGRVLENEQALTTERDRGIAAHGCARCRVVEAFTDAVVVDDDDRGGRRHPGRQRHQRQREHQRGAQEGSELHVHFTPG